VTRPSRGILGSAVLHAIFFVALFAAVPSGRPLRVPDAIHVNLVGDPAAAQARARTSAAPANEEKAEEAAEKPAEKSPLTPEKTPNRPRDEAVKLPKKTTPSPSRVAETTTGTATVGGAGLSAEVGVDEADFEFTYYLVTLRNRIGQEWSAPAGIQGQTVRAVIYFRIRRDGTIESPKVEESSGIGFFDQSALRAVMAANPVAPLPLGFSGSTLGVHFAFEYAGR
jgi:TonB family protein